MSTQRMMDGNGNVSTVRTAPLRDGLTSNGRPSGSRLYPWYDSVWLEKYTTARAIIKKVKPEALNTFESALSVFRTRPDFQVTALDRVFDDETLVAIRQVVKSLKPTDFELHEVRQFKRFVVHDHPLFTQLQEQIVSLVSETVGEAVETSYNFLSLYSGKGMCPIHMDAPQAKWTLDLCLNQTEPWPIHISDVQAWPKIEPDAASPVWLGNDWQNAIKQSESSNFLPYTMNPGEALVFSGSSQWHYRDAMINGSANAFCDLLFFHFIPRGTSALAEPKNWANTFGVPELGVPELGVHGLLNAPCTTY